MNAIKIEAAVALANTTALADAIINALECAECSDRNVSNALHLAYMLQQQIEHIR